RRRAPRASRHRSRSTSTEPHNRLLRSSDLQRRSRTCLRTPRADATRSPGAASVRLSAVVAKKRQVSRPPVQAPKRRDDTHELPALPRLPLWAWVTGLAAVLVVVAAAVAFAATRGTSSLPLEPTSTLGRLTPAPSPGKPGPEEVPIPAAKALAPPNALLLGQSVDGITCQPVEQLAYHIH